MVSSSVVNRNNGFTPVVMHWPPTMRLGAIRSPDVSWVKKSRLSTLTAEQKQRFLPLCPDFLMELRSPSDSIKILQDKMQEYVENGVGLAWLLDPEARRVEWYQPNQAVSVFENPDILTADAVLPGFVLELQKVWDVGF